MEPKRALIITRTLQPIGGVETMNGLLEIFFQKNGYTVEFLTADEGQEKIPSYIRLLAKFLGKPAITAYRYRKLNKSYDVVICNGEYALGIKHPRLVNYFHGSFKGVLIGQKKILSLRYRISLEYQALLQYFAALNKKVIAVSDFLQSVLRHQGILTFAVISNPVNTRLFAPDPSQQRKDYLFVGSGNHWAKGIDILEALADRGHKIHCYGKGPWPNSLIGHSFTPHEKFPLLYNQHRIFIFPSRFEACSMAVLEALSSGLPVVISEVGIGSNLMKVIPEFVVPLSAGPLVYEEKLCLIEADYENFSRKARAYAEEFHELKVFEDKWLSLLNSWEATC